jgi:transposase
MLKRGDKVYTQIVRNCSMNELLPIIQGKADKGSVLYTDGFKTCDELVNYGYKKHYRVKHAENEFAIGNNHINGIENCWSLKVHLEKFRGMNKNTFYLHCKECECRYNFRNKNIYLTLLKNFGNKPLKLS